MKEYLKWISCAASLALFAGTTLAQTSSDTPGTSKRSSSQQTGSTVSSSQQGGQAQFYQAKNLIGAKVKNAQDQSLGSIKDIVFNPQNGEIFVALDAGKDRYAMVPWLALTITPTGARGKEQVSLKTPKEALQSAPTAAQDHWGTWT